jgi:oxygen-independent coproporphyrinogen-3 oxidase
MYFNGLETTLEQLKEMENDGLLKIDKNKITVTETGKPFVRNTCMAFDLRMKKRAPETQLFSMTV